MERGRYEEERETKEEFHVEHVPPPEMVDTLHPIQSHLPPVG